MKVYNKIQLIIMAISIATVVVPIATIIRGDFELNVGYLKTSLFEVFVMSLFFYLLLWWNNDGFEG